MNRRIHAGRSLGFTLVELIVTMAIVAILAGMLVPAISSVRRSVGDLGCVSNMQQLLTGLMCYTMDNRGSYPYGFYWAHHDPATWAQITAQDIDNRMITWPEMVNAYLGGKKDAPLLPVFQCPAALEVRPHPCSYVMNMIVAIAPEVELVLGQPPNAQLRPATVRLMLREGTALLWDTSVQPVDFSSLGYLGGWDIDGQRFWYGVEFPQFRYYSVNDPFGQLPPGQYGNNRPVTLNVGSNVYRNVDPSTSTWYPYQGNLRFRHNREDVCNAGFSDGSVRQFTGVFRANKTVQSHDALRRYFMINYPEGVTPDYSLPGFDGAPAPRPPTRDPMRP